MQEKQKRINNKNTIKKSIKRKRTPTSLDLHVLQSSQSLQSRGHASDLLQTSAENVKPAEDAVLTAKTRGRKGAREDAEDARRRCGGRRGGLLLLAT